MKTLLVSLAILSVVATAAVAQNVSITDYRVPVSQAKSMNASLNYYYAGVGDSTAADVGTVGLVYKQFYSSLPLAWRIDFNGSGSKVDDETSHSTNLSTSFNKYLLDDNDVFGYAGLTASHVEGYKQVASRGAVGVGYGRFIAATAFAKAIRIDQFLLKEGVITGHLSKETLVELGNIIERQGEFEDEHGSAYKPYWYEAMEQVISESGKLAGDTLGAMGILRMEEVLFQETIHDRYYGWEVRVGVGHEITTFDKSDTQGSVEGGLSFSYPLALTSQVNHRTDYSTPFDDMGEAFTVLSTTDYIYELSNRIDFIGGYQLQIEKAGADLDAVNNHALRAGFIFYIENQINIVVNGQLDKAGDDEWNRSVNASIGYRVF
jgi:hypothetical protein